jgi:hypothetical protein
MGARVGAGGWLPSNAELIRKQVFSHRAKRPNKRPDRDVRAGKRPMDGCLPYGERIPAACKWGRLLFGYLLFAIKGKRLGPNANR